jgi:sortase A
MTENIGNKNKILIRTLVILLEFLVLVIVAYLIIFPFWSALNYKYFYEENKQVSWSNEKTVGERSGVIIKELNKENNYLIIPKINVSVPIVEDDKAEDGLAGGAWRFPNSGTPDRGGNTVITGHRFKYLPPSNLTFYLLDKLEKNDFITVLWKERKYLYQVETIKIVKPNDLSILQQGDEEILTIYTCNPVFSQKERLVVVAKLVKVEELDSLK